MLDARAESYVATIVEAARRDPGIARVLREICALDTAVRDGALGLVAAHLRIRLGAPVGRAATPAGRGAAGRAAAAIEDAPSRPGAACETDMETPGAGMPPAADVFECLEALRHDDIARRIAERLGPPG